MKQFGSAYADLSITCSMPLSVYSLLILTPDAAEVLVPRQWQTEWVWGLLGGLGVGC